MNVAYWGAKAGAWGFLSCVALNYPEHNPSAKQKEVTRVYLYSLMSVLPCKFCRDSSLEYIQQLPPEPFLNDRAGFCVFIYLFKSLVNKKLGKNSCSFQEFIEQHEKYRAKCNKGAGLGCNIPAKNKCPQEIADWCEYALNKYKNYQEMIDDWKKQQLIKKILFCSIVVIAILIIIWLILPRVKQLIKYGKR